MAIADQWNPEQYGQFAVERSLPFYDLLGLLENVDHPRMADLGCGSGELTQEAHRGLGAESTKGFDISTPMLDRAYHLESPGLTFLRGSVAELVNEGPYDIIIANASLQWIPDHARVLSELRSALKEGGQLAIQVPNNASHPSHVIAREIGTREPYRRAFGEEVPKDPVATNVWGAKDYAIFLAKLGTVRQRVRTEVYLHRLESPLALVEWMKGTSLNRFRAALSPDLFDAYLRDYRYEIASQLGESGQYLYTFERILMWARCAD